MSNPMLQAIESLSDEMERFDYWFRGIIAVDLETKAYLDASNGRRRAGRPRRYYVNAPNGQTYTAYLNRAISPDNPKGECQESSYSKVFGFSAYTDREAIEKANKLFSKKFEAFQKALIEKEQAS